MSWTLVGLAAAALLALGGTLGLATWNRAAPTPAAFEPLRTLEEARAASARSGRPVLVFATADWCPHCQSLKRGALADARVAAHLRARTEPVVLDAGDRLREPSVADAVERYRVEHVPTLILVEKHRELGRLTGFASADEVLRWLDSGGAWTPERPGKRGTLSR